MFNFGGLFLPTNDILAFEMLSKIMCTILKGQNSWKSIFLIPDYRQHYKFFLTEAHFVRFWLAFWFGLKASTTRVQYREQGKVEDQKVATIAIFVHEIMEAEMASFRRENLMHQVYGVKNWISDCLAYLQNFLQKGLKSSALPLTKSQRIKAKRKYFL